MSADSNYVTANFPAPPPPPYTDIQRVGGVMVQMIIMVRKPLWSHPLYQGLRKGQEWTSLVDNM